MAHREGDSDSMEPSACQLLVVAVIERFCISGASGSRCLALCNGHASLVESESPTFQLYLLGSDCHYLAFCAENHDYCRVLTLGFGRLLQIRNFLAQHHKRADPVSEDLI